MKTETCKTCGATRETFADEAARLRLEVSHAARGRRQWIVYRLAELDVHAQGFSELSLAAYAAASKVYWRSA